MVRENGAIWVAGLLLGAALFTGCSSKDNDCKSDTDCPDGAYCIEAERVCIGCAVGQHPVNDACVEDTAEACGPRGEPCLAPSTGHGQAACRGGVCAYACEAGYDEKPTGCSIVTTPCSSDAQCTTSGLVCNEKWAICVVASCSGKADFTPCEVASPKYSYNICVSGACVEPGSCDDGSCNVPGPHFKLADTNQRKCYSDSPETTCPALGFEGQDAQYGWDVTYNESKRFTLEEIAGGQQNIVVDNVTGLMWQAGIGADQKTWSEALDYCNELGLGTYTDWRLPDPYELGSIMDADEWSPAFDKAYFADSEGNRILWTAASFAYANDTDKNNAWYVDFAYGHFGWRSRDEVKSVRCVRSEPADPPAERFVRSAVDQPVVEDEVTGLVWQGCTADQKGSDCTETDEGFSFADKKCTWKEALAYCEGLNWGGQQDWRLPNRKELQSIVDYRVKGSSTVPTTRNDAFPETLAWYYWSSSSCASGPDGAWYVHFGVGHVGINGKSFTNYVRCVRSGP